MLDEVRRTRGRVRDWGITSAGWRGKRWTSANGTGGGGGGDAGMASDLCSDKRRFLPGRRMAGQNGSELPSVAQLVVLVVFAVFVVLYGSSGVDPAPPLLLSAPPALRWLLLLVVEQDDGAAAAEIPRCLLVLVCRWQERRSTPKKLVLDFYWQVKRQQNWQRNQENENGVSHKRQFGQKK